MYANRPEHRFNQQHLLGEASCLQGVHPKVLTKTAFVGPKMALGVGVVPGVNYSVQQC